MHASLAPDAQAAYFPSMRTTLACGLALLAVLSSVQAASPTPKVANRSDLRGVRYGEIIVVKGGPFMFTGQVYNTVGLNDCPESQWKALDPEKIKRDFEARAVFLNGPRYFTMDKSSLTNPGVVVSFGKLKARHVGDIKLSLFTLLRGRINPYTEIRVDRDTKYSFEKGEPIYVLISPKKRIYVMQSYSRAVDPNVSLTNLGSLSSMLKLPAGWKYKAGKPTADFIMSTQGDAYVIQDNLKNTYQRYKRKVPAHR
ncbi:hypothetical protein BH09VER1_BH09VER1_38580 [soil metagenome]